MTLEPFYKMHGERHYVVYWDRFTPEQWREKQQADLARRKELDRRTVDYVAPGDEPSERDHRLQGKNTASGALEDRKWRHAPDGWFSWEMKSLPDAPQELHVAYWGDDGGRVFDILIDGEKLVTESLNHKRPGQFYDEIYPLPAALTAGKSKLTVKFQAHPANTAGGVFGVRIVRPEK